MRQVFDQKIIKRAEELLLSTGYVDQGNVKDLFSRENITPIEADGSTRRFWRVASGSSYKDFHQQLIIAAPAECSSNEMAEAEAAWRIGKHLKEKGVAVPDILAWDGETGLLIFEDLGDIRLYDEVMSKKKYDDYTNENIITAYKAVLKYLVVMQVHGAQDFQEEWCWDTPRYDISLMVEKESNYFLRAFWTGLSGYEVPAGVEEEFLEIARRTDRAPGDYFLHRDFQSRNIMMLRGEAKFIDFQGGRLGPLGYDVASLLIDPYCGLSQENQDELLETYICILENHLAVDRDQFIVDYNFLALQRNLQIIGAFAFLYKVRKKIFFKNFIVPALDSLNTRLEKPFFEDFPLVRNMAQKAMRGHIL
ncbi:MAG: phosphotransferase [Desulfobulbaceae bacterium]|nr:phosphotransferase [Desulfobulbaceae bacterium]